MPKNKFFTKPDKGKINFQKQWKFPFAEQLSISQKPFGDYLLNINQSLQSKKKENHSNSFLLLPFYLLLIVIFSIIIFRSWQIQVISGSHYLMLSEENRIRFQITDAPRGIIYDSNGNPLARNAPGLKVYFSPYGLEEEYKESVISKLSLILNKDYQEIKDLIMEGEKDSLDKIIIKTNISHEEEVELGARKEELPGVDIEEGIIREYIDGKVFAHIIGYTGELSSEEIQKSEYQDYFLSQKIGRSGLEKSYESDLKGTTGQKLIEVDASGKEKEILFETKGSAGYGLILNVDSELQKKATEILAEGVKNYQATGAVAIFQEVKSGRILAFVSWPSFDNNDFAKGISEKDLQLISSDPQKPLFNRVISGTYPSGSTIKPLVAAAALEEGIISTKTLFDDKGVITIGEYRFPDWKVPWGLPPNGPINVIDAISQSCDTFFYAIGGGYGSQTGLGIEKLQNWGEKFGFSQKTNIDLPGEAAGLFPSPQWKEETTGESWYLGDTYWVSIGQSYVLVTPLQLNNYINAIASGGVLYKPLLVQRIVDLNRDTIQENEPIVLSKDFISETSLDIVKEGMRKGVSQGIIYSLRNAKYEVAAKTGTAEFGEKNQQGYYDTHAWVTGFFPYEEPKISFTILLESGGESSNAANLANEIVNYYYEKNNK